jgi:hypothetical protein
VSNRQARFLRRLAERRQAALQAAEPRATDRRLQERRTEGLTGAALDARLKQLGITDRRAGPRRSGADRRR